MRSTVPGLSMGPAKLPMDYRKRLLVEAGSQVKLAEIDPDFHGKHTSHEDAKAETQIHRKRIRKFQNRLFAESKHSLLIVLQGMDAGGKDGTVRHVMGSMNALGTIVTCFKQPTGAERNHDFLWRVHPHAPAKGMIAIFNRSHYEEVLVVRVHQLVPRPIWSKRYQLINDFEKLLHQQNNTSIIKFFLHISPEEQLRRFKARLTDPARNWKISEDDYKEREYWDDYRQAYEDVFTETSTKHAPWYIIPANHKWFRNLAISQIVAATMDDLGMKVPEPKVDLDRIRREYHEATEQGSDPRPPNKHEHAAKTRNRKK